MARSKKQTEFGPSGFFVLRTPLLPFEEVEAWSAGLALPAASDDPEELAAAVTADRKRLRERVRELLNRPEIREALFVASPSLVAGLQAWHRDPDGKKGRRAEEALVRYFLRMASRPTPFGLFSGCTVGAVGAHNQLRLAPRSAYQRHTRLDMDYLFALSEDLVRLPELRRALKYRPNTSIYHSAGRLRYAESRLAGQRRSYDLVAVDSTDYLEETLERARPGATVAELARALTEGDDGGDPEDQVSPEEAEEFIDELIDTQLLVSSLAPNVTGPEPIHDLIDQLAEHPAGAGVTACLESVRDALAELDAAGLGAEPERYRAVARSLETLPTQVELPRLFQVDMFKPAADVTLGPAVLAEIERGIGIVRRLTRPRRDEQLARFRRDFIDRYGETRTVPLVEVLDEEVGIGFERARTAEASPLLAGLGFPTPPEEPTVPWGQWAHLRLRKLAQALRDGAHQVEIEEADLKELDRTEPAPLPDAFEVLATVAAESPQALRRGEFQLRLKGVVGPSGARLLGRFCHGHEGLRRHVEGHLREEEEPEPEAIFAEIVHLPEGRLGNILSRPVLRPWEIPFLGRGGAPEEHQIPVTDLLVSLSGPSVVLHSQRLGRRVIPRLTSAHNYSARSLGVYRFLCTLQSQGVAAMLGWDWGALDRVPFLPRVTAGRLVLSRARWLVAADEIRKLARNTAANRFDAVREWHRERGLPRWVVLADRDNELLVDFDNVLSIETFVALVRRRSQLTLTELFPPSDQLCAGGPEGRFVHELLIPFVRRREVVSQPALPAVKSRVRRSFPPGSEWLYAKLYTGTATADQVLRHVVRPVVRHALASGAADRWFFVRLGDPHWHLRLRFHGDPQRLLAEVLPLLRQMVTPLVDDGQLWRMQVDTYDRELERYGGDEGIELAERLFHVDSEAVLALIGSLEGDEGADARWRLALRGSDQLISDLGFDAETRFEVLKQMQESYAREFRVDSRFRKQLAARLRQERPGLDELLGPEWDDEHPLSPGLAILDQRSRQIAPVVSELRACEQAGRLAVPVARLATSYVHMFNNRLLRSDNRSHEAVLYDFLYRLRKSLAARGRQR